MNDEPAYSRRGRAIALGGVLLLSACARVRYPTSYALIFPRPAARTPAAPREALGPVLIREFRCPQYLCQGSIVYRPNPEEVGFYQYHRWAMNPQQSITQAMADTLRAQSIFKYVAAQERGTQAAYVLTGNIERLEKVDHGREVSVVFALSVQLIDEQTGLIVWSGAESETVALEKRDMNAVVSSLTGAGQTAIDRLLKSMATQLASTP